MRHATTPPATAAEAGFTLLELVVSLSLIAMAVVGVMGVMSSTIGVAVDSANRARAVALVTKEIEGMRAIPYDQLVPDSIGTRTEVVGGASYTIATAVVWTRAGQYKQATAEASWTDLGGHHSVHQSSYYYPGGLGPVTTTTAAPSCSGNPNPPTSLALQAAPTTDGSTAVDVSWSPGAASGSAIAAWIVQRSGDSSSTWQTVTDTEPSSSRAYRDAGLTPLASYSYRMGALDVCGASSPWSTVVTITTPATAAASCELMTPNVTPARVRLASNANNAGLATAPLVSVQTNGSCTGFTVRYTATGTTVLTRVMTVASGGISAALAAQGPWDVGVHPVDVYDAALQLRSTVLLTVCRHGSATC